MAYPKRAIERERLLREKLHRTHAIVVTWRTVETNLLVNFLDARSRLPVTHQRVWNSLETVAGIVERSIDPPRNGPRLALFQRALQDGRGEIEILVSGEQFGRLKA